MPFIMDGICAGFFTLFLLLLFILQLLMLIIDPKKLCTIFHYYATASPEDEEDATYCPPILQYFPKEPYTCNAIYSDSKMSLTNLRSVCSTPALSNTLTLPAATFSRCLDADHSCTFVNTGQVLPVVDIAWNYANYRYRAFDDCLRNHYGDKCPPGQVLLNSMQLNLLDSTTDMKMFRASTLFDFAERNEFRLSGVRPEIEYLDPLDYFVARHPVADPVTVDRSAATEEEARDLAGTSSEARRDAIGPVITIDGREKKRANGRSSVEIEASCKRHSSRRVPGTNERRRKRPL